MDEETFKSLISYFQIPFGTILGIVILYNILAIIDNTQLGNIINGTGDVWMYITLGYNFAQVLVRLFFCITINCLIKRIDAVVATAKPLPNSTVSKYGVKISQVSKIIKMNYLFLSYMN